MERRQHDNALIEARWAGVFAQAAPKEGDRLLKRLLAPAQPRRVMTGGEIIGAMKAWAQAVS